MNRIFLKALALVSLPTVLLLAREDTTPVNGLHLNTARVHALTNATVVVAPGQVLKNTTVVVRDGLIESVGEKIEAPEDARIWDMTGKTVYAGFIDAYSQYGMPEGLKTFRFDGSQDGPPKKMAPTPDQTGQAYWNPLVTPERDPLDYFQANTKAAGSLNDDGFTSVATFPARGIFRGQGLLVHTDGSPIQNSTIKSNLAQHIAFDLWNQSRSERPKNGNTYPASGMGSIALVRQTLYDAQWYKQATEAYQTNPGNIEPPEKNSALEALQPFINQTQWALFKADHELVYQRIEKVADEFGFKFAILGNGYEYRRAEILREMGTTVIIPLSFPGTPHVERSDKSLSMSLEQLQHWELAPSNAAFLAKAGVPLCFTGHFNSGSGNGVWNAIRKSVKRGLSEEDALAAITTNPAKLYNIDGRLGTIEKGKIANLVVATGNLFSDSKARVSELWIQGEYIEKKPANEIALQGFWHFTWSGVTGFEEAEIKGEANKFTLKIGDTILSVSYENKEIIFAVSPTVLGEEKKEGLVRLQAFVTGDTLSGSGQLPNGKGFSWSAQRMLTEKPTVEVSPEKKDEKEPEIPELVFDRYPAGVHGVDVREKYDSVLIQNTTLWTSGPEGKLEDSDLLIENGKIKAIGKNLKAPRDALVIDGDGKHVTPGLIDCHSHVGGSEGLNEGGSAKSVWETCSTRRTLISTDNWQEDLPLQIFCMVRRIRWEGKVRSLKCAGVWMRMD
jgi:imidazolonepropionase-like amidohydrolase